MRTSFMLLSNTAAAGVVFTCWSLSLVGYLQVRRVPEGAGSSTARGRTRRQLVVLGRDTAGWSLLLHTRQTTEPEPVPVFPAQWWPSIDIFTLCLSGHSPFDPSDTCSCSPAAAVLQEAAAHSICFDLCECSKLLFFPSYNSAFLQGEMPAPKSPHITAGLVTCCCWCLFGDTCWTTSVVPVGDASTLPQGKARMHWGVNKTLRVIIIMA